MRGRPILLLLSAVSGAGLAGEGSVSFQEEVASILVRRCLPCHGPSKAFAGYRLDTFARLMAESDAGRLIEPGRPDESLFLDLILLTEPTGRMPKAADPLPEAEIRTLRRWIEQGATSGGLDRDAELGPLVAKAKARRPGKKADPGGPPPGK